MKKNYLKNLVLIALLAITMPGFSQAFSWFNSVGSYGADVYSNGTHVYRIGAFTSTTTAGSTTLTSAGNYDILITKSDINGNVIWAKNYGGVNDDRGTGLCVDATGNVYITGYFTGTTTTLGSNTYTNNANWSEDAYVAKLDPSGNMLWSMHLPNDTYFRANSITCDAAGNDIYMLGTFHGTLTVGSNTFAQNGYNHNCLIKFDPAGSVVWAKRYAQTEAKKVEMDAAGNGYFLCSYFGSAVIGTFTVSSGGSLVPAGYVAKFDGSGNITSVANFRGTILQSFCVDGLWNIWVTGSMSGTATMGTYTLTSNGNTDIVIAKANSTGSITLAKNYGATPSEFGAAICADPSNNIYVSGNKVNTAAFGTLSTPDAAFFAKFDNAGTEQWITSIPGTVLGDQGNDICSDNNGNIFSTGIFYASFSQPITVNSTTYTQGGGFLTKLNPAGSPSSIKEFSNVASAKIFPNPSQDLINIDVPKEVKINTITIYNTQLQEVLRTDSSKEINVSALPAGLYILDITVDGGKLSSKFIKQ